MQVIGMAAYLWHEQYVNILFVQVLNIFGVKHDTRHTVQGLCYCVEDCVVKLN